MGAESAVRTSWTEDVIRVDPNEEEGPLDQLAHRLDFWRIFHRFEGPVEIELFWSFGLHEPEPNEGP